MTTLDDIPDLFPAADAARTGAAAPRKCYRHSWMLAAFDPADPEHEPRAIRCTRCGREYDRTVSRRSRNNRARGGREEAKVAAVLGGRKVGPLGLPHDVEVPGYMRLQVKQLDRWPSLARVIQWLDAMQPAGDVRGVTVADTPGPGGRTRRLLIVDLDEYAAYHGGEA